MRNCSAVGGGQEARPERPTSRLSGRITRKPRSTSPSRSSAGQTFSCWPSPASRSSGVPGRVALGDEAELHPAADVDHLLDRARPASPFLGRCLRRCHRICRHRRLLAVRLIAFAPVLVSTDRTPA